MRWNASTYMLASSFFFSLMSLTVKILERIPAVQTVFFRTIISFILCYVFLKRANVPIWGNNKKLLLLRGFSGCIGLFCFFHAVKLMPLASAVTIQYLSPLFTIIFAVFLQKNRIAPLRWLFFLLAFAGAAIIKEFQPEMETIPFIIALSGAVGAGLAYNFVGMLKDSDHPLVIIFYFSVVALPLITPFTIYQWVWPTAWEFVLLISVGVFVQIAQYYMTLSFRDGKTDVVTIVKYVGVVLAILYGYFFFGELPSVTAFLGIALILSSVVANTLYKKNE